MKFILPIILILSFSAYGEDGWYENGNSVADNLWRKHDGSFKAKLFMSDDPETIYRQWNEGPANKVKFIDLPKIGVGKNFEAIVVFSGCTSDKNEKCTLTGDWTLTTLKGDVLAEIDDAPVYAGPGQTVDNQLMISMNGIGLAAESGVGGYQIKVTVRDKNGKNHVTLQRTLVVE